MTAVKQTVEYIDEEHVLQCAEMLLQHINNPHMRVRYAVLEAIGQLAIDHTPYFQENAHAKVQPIIAIEVKTGPGGGGTGSPPMTPPILEIGGDTADPDRPSSGWIHLFGK